MSGSRRDIPRLLGDLVRTIEQLQSELEADGRPPLRPPTPRELARFTSEVTIPGLVFLLETNVRALQLLQRTLRLAAGEDVDETGGQARQRAEALGRQTLSRLDTVLADLQGALEGRPADDPARELLAEARNLRAEIDEQLAPSTGVDGTDGGPTAPGNRERVDIDVESELQNIKENLDEDGPDEGE